VKIKHSDKKEVISRLVEIPKTGKRPFWAREVKFLNDLLEVYSKIDFWKKVSFFKKFESLLALKGDYGKKVLRKKYLEYNFIIPEEKRIELEEFKSGEDFDLKPKKDTIRKFLMS
jgi:hypothetical protein